MPHDTTASRTLLTDCLRVNIYANQREMASAAAHRAHACLKSAIESRGHARAVLASAASQIQFLGALTQLPGLDWAKVTLFHMDEYLGVTADHPASFRRFLRERVEVRVHPRAYQYLQGEALEPIKECQRYSALLKEAPIDLCCIGIGENGHIAFNDPPVADFSDPLTVKLVKLDEPCRRQQVGEGAFPTFEAVPQFAYTVTIPALCSATTLVCVVPERRKAQAVRNTLLGAIQPECPASILRRQPHATLFLDSESASLL